MSYEHVISNVVKAVEAVGAGIMVIGGFAFLVVFLRDATDDLKKQGRTSGFVAISVGASCSAWKCLSWRTSFAPSSSTRRSKA